MKTTLSFLRAIVATTFCLLLVSVGSAQANPPLTENALRLWSAEGARITEATGPLIYRQAGVDWQTPAAFVPVGQGTQLWTDKGSSAGVRLNDGSQLRLGAATQLSIQAMAGDFTYETSVYALYAGTASIQIRNSNSSSEIDTPVFSARAQGRAQFEAKVTPTGSFLSVSSGYVLLQTSQSHIWMQKGDSFQVTTNGAIIPGF